MLIRKTSLFYIRRSNFCVCLFVENVEKGSSAAPIQVNPMRFRPNLVIAGGAPYAEDGWQCISIGNKYFTVSSYTRVLTL